MYKIQRTHSAQFYPGGVVYHMATVYFKYKLILISDH